ncbi:MAG: chitobiase/beta-hexosaminidase C-terminal domain-containing protein [Thermodesulfobacteriota bacterium]|nr:chitobiase/beta-hexosaminidase C-terminal domain-containing protein [Thermodesulfobacteriota bacterium]
MNNNKRLLTICLTWLVLLLSAAPAAALTVGGVLDGTYAADEDITTTDPSTVSTGASVIFDTPGKIHLTPGFSVNGGTFTTDDGLPDDWEMQYLGTVTQGPSDHGDDDGLTNMQEYELGTDPSVNADTDGDGLTDGEELTLWGEIWDEDMDGDGVINLLDADSDNDGLSDGQESGTSSADLLVGDPLTRATYTTDGNIITLNTCTITANDDITFDAAQKIFLRPGFSVQTGGTFTTDDGLPDDWEMQYFGTVTHGPADDPDGDGLTNRQEYDHTTDPTATDTDADGISDSDELALWGDAWNTDPDNDGLINLIDPDSDNDGLDDGEEKDMWTEKDGHTWDGDIDGDGIINLLDVDSDGDGMSDGWEEENELDFTDPSDADGDADGDGITNQEEYDKGSDPNVAWEVVVLCGDVNQSETDPVTTINSTGDIITYPDCGDACGDCTATPFIDTTTPVTCTAHRSITLGPGFRVDPGARFTAIVDDTLPNDWEMDHFGTLDYGPNDDPDHDGLPNIKEYTFGTDPMDGVFQDNENDSPVVIVTYPDNGTTITPNSDGSVDLIVAFGDAGFGVKDVTLINEEYPDTPITGADVNDNSLIYTIPQEDVELGTTVTYTVIITDYSGNEEEITITFTVEEPIETKASPAGGTYTQPVKFSCNKDGATIYYSTDGYPPDDSSATVSASQAGVAYPSAGITLTETTCLQFYAKVGTEKEETQKEIYYLNTLPDKITSLTASVDASGNVTLNWVDSGADSYNIYRARNAFERKILQDSIDGQYAPPQKLYIGEVSGTSTSYTDASASNLTFNYGYTVSAVVSGETGIPADMATANFTPGTKDGLTTEDAIERAIAWLEANQYEQGYWNKGAWSDETSMAELMQSGRRMLFTSQSADALFAHDADQTDPAHAGILEAALYYLRGHYADNNDYLARKILTLDRNDQNVDMLVARLIAYSKINEDAIQGWGVQSRFAMDALDTALGILATETIYPFEAGCTDCKSSTARSNLADITDLMSADGTVAAPLYGWVPGKEDPSVFVSALVYNVVGKNTAADQSIYQWVLDGFVSLEEDDKGYFGAGIADTAAALMWLDLSSEADKKNKAINYLIIQQQADGSWENNSYLTALCVYAMLNPVPMDSDADYLPDELETNGCTDVNDADTDNDGILDGLEDIDRDGVVDANETDPCLADTDADGLQDGTESGLTSADIDPSVTDTTVFIADADPDSQTDPLNADTDADSVPDGEEDANQNGAVDSGEGDPNAPDDISMGKTVFASFDDGSNVKENAFDDNENTAWRAEGKVEDDEWISVDFGTEKYAVNWIRILGGGRTSACRDKNPGDFIVQGSNVENPGSDKYSSDWTTLSDVMTHKCYTGSTDDCGICGGADGYWDSFTFSNTEGYRHIRIWFISGGQGGVSMFIQEIEMFGARDDS